MTTTKKTTKKTASKPRARKRVSAKKAARQKRIKTAREFGEELQEQVIAVSWESHQLRTQLGVTHGQQETMAASVKAKAKSIGVKKKLFPEKHPALKMIGRRQREAKDIWLRYTLPFRRAERLLRRDRLEAFEAEIEEAKAALAEACEAADEVYQDILDQAAEDIGEELFDRSDYPASLKNGATVGVSYENFKPDPVLLDLAPEVYRRTQERVSSLFEDAVLKFEEDSRNQLAELVNEMLRKLTEKSEEGKTVKYSESFAKNLRTFFEQFKSMGMDRDDDLVAIITEAEGVLGDTTMADVKKDAVKRQELTESFGKVKEKLTDMIVNAPARKIDIADLED